MACCSPNASTPAPATAVSNANHTGALATPKVHMHLHVPDLAKAIAFYRAFFGANPVKVKPGYAKFLPIWGPVNLALSEHPAATVGAAISHLGIQLTSPAAVQAHLQRVKASGLTVREEMGVDCCHANQDKFWITDPIGVEWEIYHLNFDIENERTVDQAAKACCSH